MCVAYTEREERKRENYSFPFPTKLCDLRSRCAAKITQIFGLHKNETLRNNFLSIIALENGRLTTFQHVTAPQVTWSSGLKNRPRIAHFQPLADVFPYY